MTIQRTEAPVLRRFLLANAVFSGLSGTVALFAADGVADLLFARGFSFLGLTASGLVLEIGIILLIFAGLVFFTARRETLKPSWVKAIIVADLLWVVDSVAALLFFPHYLTGIGIGIVLALTLAVLLFAAGQIVGLGQAKADAVAQPA
ncbi:MAG: hypothetical protein OXT06_03405 [Rhodospirillaceae bacterium]|nr:hypothetical protein [Rhodospirillaceae bacterium]MDD9917689.1 hypothetical protein [Rhodospirillaceae bacterium]MDD9927698.1 hypothetical protein [Rhodospirillaceae bacterium]